MDLTCGEGLSLLLHWLVSKPRSLFNLVNLDLKKFHPVDPHKFTENDRLAYIEGIRELIDLDAVVVVVSSNIDVQSLVFTLAHSVTDN